MEATSLASLAQSANLPYPDFHVTGSRRTGYQVRENGQVIASGFGNSVQAQRWASAERDRRWAQALRASRSLRQLRGRFEGREVK